MTRQDAVNQVKGLFRSFGQESGGLNEYGFGGVELGQATIAFEYDEKRQVLICHGYVDKWHREPTKGELQAYVQGFLDEEKKGTRTGGGRVNYMPENRGLFLSREYASPVTDRAFLRDMNSLAAASLYWSREVFNRVLERMRLAKQLPPYK